MRKDQGSLYIISTPIGNLEDITIRAIETLKTVDLCACEDTRVSRVLFNKYQIKTKLISYHKFSEKSKSDELIKLIISGKNIALISDAGTPLISDPGKILVHSAIENNINIIPIPGPTSVIAALSVSGFDLENFTFFGFFPRKQKERKALLSKLKNSKNPSVFFESGKRIEKLFDIFQEELNPSLNILVAREMTKIHETFYRGQVGTIKDQILETDHGLKGEFVIVLDHSSQSQSSSFEGDELRVMEILTTYLDQKLALKIASEILDKSRNELYKLKF